MTDTPHHWHVDMCWADHMHKWQLSSLGWGCIAEGHKIMRQRGEEIRLLYGTMTNYWMVMDYKPQPEGAASPRTSTNNRKQ